AWAMAQGQASGEQKRLDFTLGQASGEQKGLVFTVEQGEKKKVVLNLDSAIKRALEVDDRIKESRSDVDVFRGKRAQADGAQWPQLTANVFTGPSPESDLRSSRGIIDSASDTSDPVINGIFGRAQILLVQPLYTFGKISAYREAAGRGVRASEAAVSATASEVVLQVKQAYAGALLAGDIREFLLGLKDELQRSLESAERRYEAGSAAVTLGDLYQLRAFVAGLEKGIADADQGDRLARDALRTLLQLGEGVQIELADKKLSPIPTDVKSVAEYERVAGETRPEFTQLREGIKAREALVQASIADLYPVVYAALVADMAGATNRDISHVPIITDPLMHYQGGFIVGLNWQFDFGIKRGKIDEAQADYSKLLYKQDFAEWGIPLQVRKAHLELETAQENIKSTEQAYRNARRWLVTAVANVDLGVGDVRELTQAFLAYVTFRVDNFRAIYNQQIALANLAYATGEAVRGFSARP
ncbi:MAG TPA: TolC family protein, partial [Candidatus Methylomirabilis sp.]|nr:TolC family protein [Candidatus Methylomirabilis sp.]